MEPKQKNRQGPTSNKWGLNQLPLISMVATALVAMAYAPASNATSVTNNHQTPWDECFDASGAKWKVSPALLKGIAKVESDFKPNRVSPADAIGVMQVHSSWLPKLKTFGIERKDLFDACTNIDVGAWILSSELGAKGDSWNAVGAFNASCTKLKGKECVSQRAWYSWKVFQAMSKMGHAPVLAESVIAPAPKTKTPFMSVAVIDGAAQ